MFKNSLFFLVVSIALSQTTAERQVMSGSAGIGSGVSVRYKTVVTSNPSHPYTSSYAGGVKSGKGVFHRYMASSKDGVYLGYDLVLGPGDAVNGYQVTVAPLTNVDDMLRGNLHPVPLLKYPAPQILHDGDTIVLDLMTSASGEEKMTDYLEFSLGAEPKATTSTAQARDFTVDDGTVHLDLSGIRTLVDGQAFQGQTGFDVRPGSTFWFAIPNQGRYILSLTPHAGFVQSGEVRDNVIRFQDAGRQYEFRTAGKVVGSGGAYNLYLMRDPNFQPRPNNANAITGGVDRLENLLPKQ